MTTRSLNDSERQMIVAIGAKGGQAYVKDICTKATQRTIVEDLFDRKIIGYAAVGGVATCWFLPAGWKAYKEILG